MVVGPPMTDVRETLRSTFGFEGFRLRPAVTGHDLGAIVDDVVPALQRRGAFRQAYEPGSLRQRLGLSRPVSRYARSA